MRKRLLSWLLILAMVVGMIPTSALPVYAAEQQTEVTEEQVVLEGQAGETAVPEETLPQEGKAEETVTPEEGKTEEILPEEGKTEETVTPEEGKTEETLPEEGKTEETVTPEEEPKTEDSQRISQLDLTPAAEEKVNATLALESTVEIGGVTYERLDQAPMKASAQADSAVAEKDWGDGKDGGSALAFDGDPSTVWHTDWEANPKPGMPHWISWELGDTYTVGRISYTRKNTAENGTWKDIEVFAEKTDGSEKSVYKGTLSETAKGATTNIDFETPVEAKGFKIVINSNYKGDEFAAAGEINVYAAKAVAPKPEYPTFEKAISIVPDEGKTNITLKEGETRQLQYELTEDAKAVGGYRVEWQEQNNGIVTLDKNGLLTGVGEGTTKVGVNYIVDVPGLGSKSWNSSIDVVVERVNAECVIAINGVDYTVNNLEEAIEKSKTVSKNQNGFWQSSLESIEYKSGVVRAEDFEYLKANLGDFKGRKDKINLSIQSFKIGDDVIPRGLTDDKIPANVFAVSASNWAMIGLKNVYLGNHIKGCLGNALSGNRYMTGFEAPGIESFGSLSGNTGLKDLVIPNAKEITGPISGSRNTNSDLTELHVPKIEKINNEAFRWLPNLTTLELGANPPQVVNEYGNPENMVFASGVAKTIQLVIPEGALANYQADEAGYNAADNTWWGIPLAEAVTEHVHATHDGAEAIKFEPLPEGFTGGELASGNYYLTKDIVLDSAITIVEGSDVNFCLNGHKISTKLDADGYANDYVFKLWNQEKLPSDAIPGGNLSLCDCIGGGEVCQADQHTGATYAWAVHVGSGTVNLYSGKLTGAKGIYVDKVYASARKGTVNIYGGEISAKGYAVHNALGGVTNIFGGKLSGENIGVYAENDTVNINGGSISSSKYAVKAGQAKLNLSGAPVLNGTVADVYSYSPYKVNNYENNLNGYTGEALDVELNVGAGYYGKDSIVFTNVDDANKDKINILNEGYQLDYNADTKQLVLSEKAAEEHVHEDVTFNKAINGAVTELAEGNYYLNADITEAKTVNVSGDVKLCLNGHTMQVRKIVVSEGASFTVCDCGETGKITSTAQSVVEVNGGTFTLESGRIETTSEYKSSYGTINIPSGSANSVVNINGGTVAGGKYAIYAYSANINIAGGKITKNPEFQTEYPDMLDYKYAVVVYNGTTVNMTGGTVEGLSVQSGGSVANISGGTVDGIAHVKTGATLNISGSAKVNSTLEDYAVLVGGNSATCNISGGTISGGSYGVNVEKLYSTDYSMLCLAGSPVITGKTADILMSREKQIYGQNGNTAYAGEKLTIAATEDFSAREGSVIVVVKDPIQSADMLDKFEYQNEDFTLAADTKGLVLKKITVKEITLGEKDHKIVYVKPGETLQLNPVNKETNEPVEATYKLNHTKGFITVGENSGLVTGVKTGSQMHETTQVTVTSVENPAATTWIQIVVPRPAEAGKTVLVGPESKETYENFVSGGYVSDNAQHKYELNVDGANGEWNDSLKVSNKYDRTGTPEVTWYVDGVEKKTIHFNWYNPGSHYQGIKDPDPYETDALEYGKHTVKAVVTGNDGSSDTTEEFVFINIPVWTSGTKVTKINENAGVVEIPEVINGQTITSLEAVGAAGSPGVRAGITELTVPATVTKISANFFADAVDLTKITMLGTTVPTVEGTLELPENADIQLVVPAGALAKYQADTGYNPQTGKWHGLRLAEKQNVVTVLIDGTEYGGDSLEQIITANNLKASDVTSIEFVSGKITPADLAYMKDSVTYLETLKMNLSDALILVNEAGESSTVLPGGSFKGTRLVDVELGGFTEIEARAFEGATKLETVKMPNVEVIGSNAFYHTTEFEKVTLPACIKTLNDCGFGVAANGTKKLQVTMEGAVPPTLNGSVFSKAKADSYVKVPEGSLSAYLPDLDLSKTFGNAGETKWGSLRVVDPGYSFVTFYKTEAAESYNKTYGYVRKGAALNTVTVEGVKVPEGKVLKEWNTKKAGAGDVVALDAVITEDMTLYPVFANAVDETAPQVTTSEALNDDNTVTVTMTSNEPLQTPEGWTKADEEGKVFTKVYDKNGSGTVVVKDLAGNQAEVPVKVTLIDEKAPTVTVKEEHNKKDNTVTVTMTSNEPLQTPEGWTKADEEGKVFTKVYDKNGSETVVVKDLAGNQAEVPVKVTLVDDKAPTVTVKQEHNDKDNTVKVTITTDEPVETPEGWTKVDDQTFEKVYKENGKYQVVVKDGYGNETKVEFEVTQIAKEDHKPGKPEDDKKPGQGSDDSQQGGNDQQQTGGQAAGSQSAKTGDPAQTVTLLSVMMLALAAAVGMFFRRKKN